MARAPFPGHAFYSQVLSLRLGGESWIRFDPCCMAPVEPIQNAVADTLATLRRYATPVEIEWSAGDLLLIDNWRCLHHRSDASRSLSRVLRRWELGSYRGLVG